MNWIFLNNLQFSETDFHKLKMWYVKKWYVNYCSDQKLISLETDCKLIEFVRGLSDGM